MYRLNRLVRHITPNTTLNSVRSYHTTASSNMSATAGYRLHHTMMRIKDVEKSKDFYTRILGMTHIATKDFGML